ncbi:MAG: hypothetical protein AAF533_03485 [Acidobacteriota bacterium]
MKIATVPTFTLSLALAASVAQADSFKKLDLDGNGEISQAELLAHVEQRMKTGDTNGDGVISQDEWRSARGERRDRLAKRGGKGRLARLDANGDGQVDWDEFKVTAEKPNRADTNGDGIVERSEIPDDERSLRRFEKADLNGDGRVDFAEREDGLREKFAKLDQDADGLIALDDIRQRSRSQRGERGRFQGLRSRLEKLDTNGDGALDEAEFLSADKRAEARLDIDGNGVLTKDELPEGPGLERQLRFFDRLDLDHDGRVDEAEVDEGRRQKFQDLDRNGDGLLTEDELGRSRRSQRQRFERR